MTHALILIAALLAGLVLTRAMMAVRILDQPNERSSHARPVPRTGGIAVTLIFLVGLVVGYFWLDLTVPPFGAFTAFVVLLALLFAASLADDIHGLPPWAKLAAQAVCALGFSLFVIDPSVARLPWLGLVEWGLFGHLVVLAWMVPFINAFNFMDGIDGIGAGTAAIAMAFLALALAGAGWSLSLLAAIVLLGALLGFLVYNFPRGLIFLGDSGSQVIGFAVAALAILAHLDPALGLPILFLPLLFFSFLFDVCFTLIVRWRRGRRLMRAHREHLYQRLTQLGWSHAAVSALHFAVQAAIGAALLAALSDWDRWLPWIGLAALAAHGAYAAIVHAKARRAGLWDE